MPQRAQLPVENANHLFRILREDQIVDSEVAMNNANLSVIFRLIGLEPRDQPFDVAVFRPGTVSILLGSARKLPCKINAGRAEIFQSNRDNINVMKLRQDGTYLIIDTGAQVLRKLRERRVPEDLPV